MRAFFSGGFVSFVVVFGVGFSSDAHARDDKQKPKVEWSGDWDRFTPNEAALTIGVTVCAYILDKKLPDYEQPKADFEVPLIDPWTRGLRARTKESQFVWARWSDIGFRVGVLYPYILDAGIVALGIHHNVDVAAQLFLIDLEFLSIAGIFQLATSRLTSRTRPFVQDCGDDQKTVSHDCGERREHRSFYGGHASATFTSAGLTCLHHQNLPLWGGGAPDVWACVWALSFASVVSAARVVADEHWMSDTIVGIGTGLVFGYILPRWLHYGTKSERPKSVLQSHLILPGNKLDRNTSFLFGPSFATSDDGSGGTIGVRAIF